MRRRPPRFPLFPYTTLFRSGEVAVQARHHALLAALDLLAVGELAGQRGPGGAVLFTGQLVLAGGHLLVEPLEAPGEKVRSEEHTSELQSLRHLVCRLLLEKK